MSGFLSTWVGLLWKGWAFFQVGWPYFRMVWAYFRERGFSKIRQPPSLSSRLVHCPWVYFREPTVFELTLCSHLIQQLSNFLGVNCMCIAFLHYNVQWSLNVPCTMEHNFVGCLHTQGSGLHCQRAISAICELAGLKNMRAKIIGSTNPLNIVRAVFKGLTSQVSIVSTMTQYSSWVRWL